MASNFDYKGYYGFSSAENPVAATVMDVDPSESYYNAKFDRNTLNKNNSVFDTPDVVVPPLAKSVCKDNNGSSSVQNARFVESGQECASDSRKLWPIGGGKKQMQREKDVKVGPFAPCREDDELYNMRHPCRGTCIVFNHVNFDERQELASRAGSEVDVQRIGATFSGLGFRLTKYDDLKFDKIIQILFKIAQEDHSKEDCLAVFVLTHGQTSELHAYDISYKPSSLWNIFTADKCPTLAGKPKMFFFQACRGDQYDNGTTLHVMTSRTQVDGPTEVESYRIPNQADFLTVYSTSEGYYSWRNSKTGSCFIQRLCDVISEYSDRKDVLAMLTLVNRKVALTYESRSKDSTQDKKKQVPHVCHTLTREVYFTRTISTLV